jgi:hypothetical protein
MQLLSVDHLDKFYLFSTVVVSNCLQSNDYTLSKCNSVLWTRYIFGLGNMLYKV